MCAKINPCKQETVTVAASVYLAELPQWQRKAALQVIQDSVDSQMDFGSLAQVFYPGNFDNILSTCDLPGWKEGLTKRLAVVFDPHNIAQAHRLYQKLLCKGGPEMKASP